MNIGLFGFGTIGSGVYELLESDIKKVFDLPVKKELLGEKYVSDPYEIINDKSIDLVVEALGGDTLPYEIIKSSLINKKHVVTSNKEVVSKHLKEFLNLAKLNQVHFRFEASVGGGIPIINTLINSTSRDKISSIKGIMNGTTNYILSRIEDGMSYDDSIVLAKNNGFAERDPSADLNGLDMVRKIAILSDIAYNTFIDINDINSIPITGISNDILTHLSLDNKTIKYIASSYVNGNQLSIKVEPTVVDKSTLLSQTKDEFNYIEYDSIYNSTLSLYGKGAGKYPTSSAILSDINYIKDNNKPYYGTLENIYNIIKKEKCKYFIYSNKPIDEKLIEKRIDNYYYTKEINLSDLNINPIFIARIE